MIPTSTFDFYDLDRYLFARKNRKCCYQGKEYTYPSDNELSTTGADKSVYYIREDANWQREGKAYLIESDDDIIINITKTFITDFDNTGWSIYRMTDEELGTCAYTQIGQRTYSLPTGTIYSHDNLFKLILHSDLMTPIYIKTINIEECGLYDINDLQIEYYEEPPEEVILYDVMKYAKDYTDGSMNADEAYFKIYGWSIR